MRLLLNDREIATLASMHISVVVQPFNWSFRCWQPMRPTPSPVEGYGRVGFWGINAALGPIGIMICFSPQDDVSVRPRACRSS